MSDHRVPLEGVGSSSFFHFLTVSQSCFILRTATFHLSNGIVLINDWTLVNRMSKGLVEDDSQVYLRVCGSSPIPGGRGFRQAV